MMQEDLFGNPVTEKPRREQSKADIEKAGRITYSRRSRHAAPANCHDCIDLHVEQGGTPLHPAVYVRSEGGVHTILCFGHKQERQDRERLQRG